MNAWMHVSVENSLKHGLEAKSKGFFKEKCCCVITQSLIVGAPPFVIIITIFIE